MRLATYCAIGVLLAAFSLYATAPRLNTVSPPGGQRGTEVELKLSGERLHDAQEVVLFHPGIEVLKLDENKTNSFRARLKISPDCQLGEHHIRVRAASGLSEVRTFFVGPFATTNETEPNNEMEKAQLVSQNSTVNASGGGEDLDFYRIPAKKGDRISVEVEAVRLGRALLDPNITLQAPDGKVLATCDDTALLAQDASFSVIAPADGDYVLQVRDSTYTGQADTPYRLHVGSFPRPTAVFPAGGKAGEKLTVKFVGDAGGEFSQEVALPAEPQEKFGVYPEQNGLLSPSPNWMRVSTFENVIENEDNNSREKASGSSSPAPLALNGILAKLGDEDWFRFTARKGQALEVNVFARRIRSPVDSVVEVFDSKGNSLGQNDDGPGSDSSLKFTPAADGEHFVKVRDHLKRGGADFIYRVEIAAVQPSLAVSIPQVARNDSQSRQYIAVPKGNRFGTLIAARRNNFGGDLTFQLEGLPSGVKMDADIMAGKVDAMSLVFEASEDAPVAGKLLDLVATSTDTNNPVRGSFRHTLEFINGPNNTFYYQTQLDKLHVAVVDAVPFRIEIEEPKVPLVQSGSMALKVKAVREKGFDEPITIKMIWNPPGVTSATDVTIPKGETSGICQLNASGNADLRGWRIAVLGSATVNGGQVFVSSQLAKLEVAEPYLSGKIETVSTAPGRSTNVICKLEQKKPFAGKAKIKLVGLPEKVTAPEVEISSADTEAVFPVTVDPKCSTGSFKNLFCSVQVAQESQVIPHNIAAGGVLRIVPPKKQETKVASSKGGQ